MRLGDIGNVNSSTQPDTTRTILQTSLQLDLITEFLQKYVQLASARAFHKTGFPLSIIFYNIISAQKLVYKLVSLSLS